MRYILLLVAFLFACGGKNSNAPPASEDQSNNDRDAGPDGGTDGGVDGGVDGGTDGGVDAGLSGYSSQLRSAPRPCEGGTAGEAVGDAVICCTAESNINCQVPRMDAGSSPARRITILEPGSARITAKIYSDTQCHTLDRTLSVLLPFSYAPELWDVEVNFTPPLPLGFQLSIKWTTGEGELGCPETPCQLYTVGSYPEGCWDYCMGGH